MKLVVTLTPTQHAKLREIAKSRRTTIAHLAQTEFAPLYIAAVAQSLAPSVPKTRRTLRLVKR